MPDSAEPVDADLGLRLNEREYNPPDRHSASPCCPAWADGRQRADFEERGLVL